MVAPAAGTVLAHFDAISNSDQDASGSAISAEINRQK